MQWCDRGGLEGVVWWKKWEQGKVGGKMSRRKVVVHMSKNEWRNNGLNFIRNRGGW